MLSDDAATDVKVTPNNVPNYRTNRLYWTPRDSRKSRQKMVKNTANLCENRKNYGIYLSI